MGKLSRTLLNSIFLTSVAAQEAVSAEAAVTFAVTSCNDESSPTRPPALTYKIAKEYFDNNLSDQTDSFTLNADGDFYERTIAENDLSVSFDADSDDILLSFTQAISPNGFQVDDTSSVSFADDSLVFSCRYSRSVSANSDMTITAQDGAITGNGDLTYSMSVDAGYVGGNSVVTISPNHSISGVGARLTSCRISSGDHQIYALHSFKTDTLCFDNSRLNVIQTIFGETVAFSMRTFRFTSGGSVDNEQQQTIECNIHLEPIADITQDQAADCTCFTEDDCIRQTSTDPTAHGLPANYIYSEQSWGRIFYAIPGIGLDWNNAKSYCEADGAVLPIPRDSAQNDFIFHNAYGKVWTGINDVETEGSYVDNAGEPITWTNWWRTDCKRDFDDTDDCEPRDAVYIYGRHWSWMGATEKWGHGERTESANVVCIKYLDD